MGDENGRDKFDLKSWGRDREKKEYPRTPVRNIVEEFYACSRTGSTMTNESEKANTLLGYIEALKVKYVKRKLPMTDKDVALLGFDVDELKAGRIRASHPEQRQAP